MDTDGATYLAAEQFLAEHLAFVERLAERAANYLAQRGYSCSVSASSREAKPRSRGKQNPNSTLQLGHSDPFDPSESNDLLLELGAILQIQAWELGGLAPSLAGKLPTAAEAFRALRDRLRSGQALTSERPGAALVDRVLWIWSSQCERAAIFELGVDVVRQGDLPAEALEILADFLWRFRHLATAATQVS